MSPVLVFCRLSATLIAVPFWLVMFAVSFTGERACLGPAPRGIDIPYPLWLQVGAAVIITLHVVDFIYLWSLAHRSYQDQNGTKYTNCCGCRCSDCLFSEAIGFEWCHVILMFEFQLAWFVIGLFVFFYRVQPYCDPSNEFVKTGYALIFSQAATLILHGAFMIARCRLRE